MPPAGFEPAIPAPGSATFNAWATFSLSKIMANYHTGFTLYYYIKYLSSVL
jgi:hypothetical protein